MATYVLLAKFTEQGAKNVKDVTSRFESFKQAVRNAGGEVKQCFLAMGEFDALSLLQAPSDEVAAKIALSLCAVGNVRTETLRLFTEEETKKLVATLT